MTYALRAGLLVALLHAAGVPAAAQSMNSMVGRVPGSHMHTLLQKTLFKVDVLTIDLCFDEPTARRFAAIAARGRLSAAAADSVTRAALAGRLALARIEFLRDIPLRDFLAGVEEDLRNALTAGLLADSVYRAVHTGLPGWFAPVQRRGIRRGDVLTYELQPEAVRTVLRGRDGRVLLDRTERGRGRRNSPLATWLAPGSPFREGLLKSLQRDLRRPAERPDAAGLDGCRGPAR